MRARRLINGFLWAVFAATALMLFLPSFFIDCGFFAWAIECWFAS